MRNSINIKILPAGSDLSRSLLEMIRTLLELSRTLPELIHTLLERYLRLVICLVFALLIIPSNLKSQSDTPSKWQFQGYLKYLNSSVFVPTDQSLAPFFPSEKFLLNDNLLHNRLNLKYYANDQLTIHAEIRNRIFWGDQVRFALLSGGDYLAGVDAGSDDYFDWSAGQQNNTGYALHTTLDRFYAEWMKDNWEVRLGRQRVNWGISTIWNPNDIFNAYNFTDFDYEERPGSDALRIKRYLGFASSIEIAVKMADYKEDFIGAAKANFHTGTYDWQVLAGVVEEHFVLGGGWAGNLGNASFKGEASLFSPLENDSLDNSLALTFGVDYTFENQLYINGGVLYNSLGTTDTGGDLLSFELSARNLYPYKYSVLAQAGYPINPLLNSALIVVYSPVESHPLFLNPVLTYSLSQNWDLDLVGQFVFQKTDKYKSDIQAGFIRIKWSF